MCACLYVLHCCLLRANQSVSVCISVRRSGSSVPSEECDPKVRKQQCESPVLNPRAPSTATRRRSKKRTAVSDPSRQKPKLELLSLEFSIRLIVTHTDKWADVALRNQQTHPLSAQLEPHTVYHAWKSLTRVSLKHGRADTRLKTSQMRT